MGLRLPKCFPRPRCEREVRVPLHTYCLIGFPGGVGDEGLAETLKKITRFPWATEGVRQTDQTDLRCDCSNQGSYKWKSSDWDFSEETMEVTHERQESAWNTCQDKVFKAVLGHSYEKFPGFLTSSSCSLPSLPRGSATVVSKHDKCKSLDIPLQLKVVCWCQVMVRIFVS